MSSTPVSSLVLNQERDRKYLEVRSQLHKQQESLHIRKRSEIERFLRIENKRSQGVHHASAIFGDGYLGYGNGWTEGKPRILYPKERKRPRRQLREISFSRDALTTNAAAKEVLVPIRLDLDFEKYKLRDTFVWNMNDNTIPLDLFAEHLCEDFDLPWAGFVPDIEKSIRMQLTEHHPHKFPDQQEGNTIEATKRSTSRYTDARDDDLRIAIKLDITIGSFNLIDQFEWDLNNSQNEAEWFASNLVLELGLAPEFETAVAHTIREQCQLYTKSLFLVGHTFDGHSVEDSDMRQMIMAPVHATTRAKHTMDKFAPSFYELNQDQLERIDKEREREGRRNRRQTRGKRGANLPDLTDLPKTYRTPYSNEVLIPEEERWATRHGIAHTAGTSGKEFEDASEDDDKQDFDDRIVSDRSARHARSTRGPVPPRTGATPSTFTGSQQAMNNRDRSSKTRHHGLPMHSLATDTGSNSRINPSPVNAHGNRFGTKVYDWEGANRSPYPTHRSSASRETTIEPIPSLIVKLKIPKLRQRNTQFSKANSDDALLSSEAAHLVPLGNSSGHTPLSQDYMQNLIPSTTRDILNTLHEQFPFDKFEAIVKANENNPQGAPNIRIRCFSCPGVLYFVDDFDVHLRNRQHRKRVEDTLNATHQQYIYRPTDGPGR